MAVLSVLLVGQSSAGLSHAPERAHVHKQRAASVVAPSSGMADVPCVNGHAGPFRCDGIDLLSFVPIADYDIETPVTTHSGQTSDLWGWVDPVNGDEYVILGEEYGVVFFRVTDPKAPVYLGRIPNNGVPLVWHDIKVYADHAFIVSESQPHGMQVFDMKRLRGVTSPQIWVQDVTYALNWAAHNLAIDTETGFAYLAGGNEGLYVSDACAGGLHIVDIRQPLVPLPAGCYWSDGYIHDAQCVVYRGPDAVYKGRELCFNSAESRVTIVDVTDKLEPTRITSFAYPDTAYAHQGWLTPDHRFFLLGDELDETRRGAPTRTLLFDVTDLDAPRRTGEFRHRTMAIDHNMYTLGKHVYQSNYAAGLRVLSTTGVAQGRLEEVAYFDTYPAHDKAAFVGTWSNYPYFPSGTIAVSGIDEGLFLLRARPGVL